MMRVFMSCTFVERDRAVAEHISPVGCGERREPHRSRKELSERR